MNIGDFVREHSPMAEWILSEPGRVRMLKKLTREPVAPEAPKPPQQKVATKKAAAPSVKKYFKPKASKKKKKSSTNEK